MDQKEMTVWLVLSNAPYGGNHNEKVFKTQADAEKAAYCLNNLSDGQSRCRVQQTTIRARAPEPPMEKDPAVLQRVHWQRLKREKESLVEQAVSQLVRDKQNRPKKIPIRRNSHPILQ